MKNLGDLLSKYKKLVSTDRKIGEAVAAAVAEVCGLEIDRKQLQIKDWTVFVKASSAVKAEIFLNRQKILDKVKDRLGSEAPKMIV